MLRSYEEFLDTIEQTIIYRSKNYANTNCDVHTLSRIVYEDICNSAFFTWVKDEYYINAEEDTLTIRLDNMPGTETQDITEMYGVPTDIVDKDDYCISSYLQSVDICKYKWINTDFRDNNPNEPIYFIRPIIYAIEHLPRRLYQVIFNAIIEGVMYHIHQSIPSQVDSAIANLSYQRYYSAKQQLINKYPQVQYVDKNIPARGEIYEYL